MGGGTERSPKEFREHWEGLGSPRVLKEAGLTLGSPGGTTGAAIIVVENMGGKVGPGLAPMRPQSAWQLLLLPSRHGPTPGSSSRQLLCVCGWGA